MGLLLMGLDAALSDDTCERIELRNTESGFTQVFFRQSEESWVTSDPESDSIHTRLLREVIDGDFGPRYDEMACFVGPEKILYVNTRGSVRLRKEPRTDLQKEESVGQVDLERISKALGIPRSKRGAKIPQALQFSRVVSKSLSDRREPKRVIDAACGRSYLGFILESVLRAEGWEVTLHGIDSNPALIDKCREIGAELGLENTSFESADLESFTVTEGSYDLLVSLHACDTLTDEAIRVAVDSRIPLLFVAPCCKQEMRNQWRRHPLSWIAQYGLLETRLADVLTDAFRALVLEALGYRVKVIRFVAAEVTPKNLIIEARLVGGLDAEKIHLAQAFMKQWGVRPRLAELLDRVGSTEGE